MGELQITVARTRRQRAQGLLGRESLDPCEALLLPRCRSVHTFGMRFPIAAVRLDRRWRVLGVGLLPPGRLLLAGLRTRAIMECRPQDQPDPGTDLRRAVEAAMAAASA